MINPQSSGDRFVLVAGGTIDLHSLDLVFFQQMGFMNKGHFFSEFNFLGAEGILRFPVACGCHAAGIGDLWDVIYGLASQGYLGKI